MLLQDRGSVPLQPYLLSGKGCDGRSRSASPYSWLAFQDVAAHGDPWLCSTLLSPVKHRCLILKQLQRTKRLCCDVRSRATNWGGLDSPYGNTDVVAPFLYSADNTGRNTWLSWIICSRVV